MADTLVSPSRTITIAGKDYVLSGDFATLRAVQEGFGKDLVYVLPFVFDMRLDQIATLVAIGMGRPDKADALGQDILDTMDLMDFKAGSPYSLLKMNLFAWLHVAMSPRDAREKKSAEMQAAIDKQTADSPGPSTSDSA
jgi:hypothetical protein